jgi:MFS family permease
MRVAPRVLSQRAGFWVSAAVAAIALWTSAAPSITYPLYAREWGLTPAVTTAIFAVYPMVLVVALAVFGNISDYIGRRAAMVIGLSASLLGVVLFAIAPTVAWLFIGRGFIGLGVALSLSPATAAMVELSPPEKRKRAGAITTASTAAGLGIATLLGGALIEYAPFPTHLNFWALAAVIMVVLVAAWFLPRHSTAEAAGRWRPRVVTVPTGIRRQFALGAIAVSTAYLVGAVVLSLGADVAQNLIGSGNALVNGATISLNALAIGVAAVVARNVRPATMVCGGGIAAFIGMATLVLSSIEHSIVLFLAAAIVTGIGYSLLFAGGLGVVSAHAPAHHRAATLSAVYLVSYFFQGVSAVFLGSLATRSGLGFAIEVGAGIIGVFSLAAIVLALTVGRRTSPATQAAA